MAVPSISSQLFDAGIQCWIPVSVAVAGAVLRISSVAWAALGIAAGMFCGLLVNKLSDRYHIRFFKVLVDNVFDLPRPFEHYRLPLTAAAILVSALSPQIGSVMGVFLGFYGSVTLERQRHLSQLRLLTPNKISLDNPLW